MTDIQQCIAFCNKRIDFYSVITNNTFTWCLCPAPEATKNIFQIKVPESENGLWQFIQNQIYLEKISIQLFIKTCFINSLGLITVNSLIYLLQNLKKGRMSVAK